MLFRTQFSLNGVYVLRGDRIELRTPGPHGATVALWQGTHPHDATKTGMFIDATIETEPPPGPNAELHRIAVGTREVADTVTMVGDQPPTDVLLDYLNSVTTELSASCFQAFRLARWRLDIDSPHHPYAVVGSTFSIDGGRTWCRTPQQLYVSIHLPRGIRLVEATTKETQSLLDAGRSEPIAHELLREATSVQGNHPRSALVIGVAAAETGFKNLVADLVADAEWLVEEVQSPPLLKMLKDFLPLLPVRLRITDVGGNPVTPPPPKYVRTLLHDGIEARNATAHRGSFTMRPVQVTELLAAVKDLLYFFDFYAGEAWALPLTSEKFRSALAAEFSLQSSILVEMVSTDLGATAEPEHP